tara:strand:- start:1507 stop:2211 length:705 start_codon:yes stop_codon:yes gene_type:complete
MNKFYFFVALMLSFSCNNPQISITKVEGSAPYLNSSLSLEDIKIDENDYTFSFDVSDYTLGMQSIKDFDYTLANSKKGQHIHFIVNNGPYSAHYSESFTKKLDEKNNIILAFLSRSYHESVKNPNAYVLTQTGNEKIDLTDEFLFYSRPKGTYKGVDTEKLLLDFYLVNTNLSSTGNKVKATIQDTEFIIEEWAPYYIEGLPKGEIKIKLELIDASGNLIDSPFNPSNRTVILE